MTRIEAMAALDRGEKIRHRWFLKNEWIKNHPTDKRFFIDELGNALNKDSFWMYRQTPSYNRDWSIYKPSANEE